MKIPDYVGNDMQGYTARELVHALDNRSSHASKRDDEGLKSINRLRMT